MSDLNLTLRIRANADGSVSVLNNTVNSVRNIGAETGRARDAIERLTASIARVGHYTALAFGGTWLGGKAKDVIMLADRMTLLDSRIKIAASSQQDYINSSKELVAISMRTGTQFEANATIFARINKAMEDMGGTARHTTALTETLAQTMRISGAGAQEAASTIRQLSQAMASGVLRGDEFNSVMENAPRLAQALADGMHVSIGALRAMAEAGELNSKRVIEAIQAQSKAVAEEAAKIPLTVGAAMTNINTAFEHYVLEADKGSGATAGLAGQLNSLANNLTPVIDSVLTLGKIAATVFAGQMVIALSTYVTAKYAAVTVEMAHAAAITMDLERTVALTAAQLANTAATVASLQAQLASATAMGARMGVTNALNVALVAQTSATAAATSATTALSAATAGATLTLKSLLSVTALSNIALAGLVGWEIGKFLNKFETVRRVANDSLYAVLSLIEAVNYRWEKMFSKRDTASIEAEHAAVAASLADLISETNTYVNAGGKVVELSSDMKSALDALKTPQEVYEQKVKDTNEALKLNAINQAQATGLLAKYKETLDQANAAAANAKLSDAGKEIVKLQDKYDKLTMSVEAYNAKHASGIKGSAEEVAQVTQLANAIDKLEAGKKSLTKTTEDYASAAKEEASFWAKSLAFLQGQAEQLRLLKLTGKDRELETKISSDLNSVLGELYDSTKVYTEAKAMLIAEVMNNTMAIARETEAQERQNAMWAESVKWHNELYDLKRDTSDTQELARMAESLHLMGATNAEIKQRIELEKRLNDAVRAHPDQDPQVIRDNIIAQQRASDEIAQYTDSNSTKSGEWMEAAFKKAAENIQDSFARMFENMLNGEATASLEKFAENIKKTLNQAISQQLALDLQNLFTGKGGVADMFKSAMLFGVSMLASWLTKKPNARTASPSEVGNSAVLGTGAMHIADGFSRDQGYEYQSKSIVAFNKSLDYLTGTVMNQVGKITDWIGALGTKLSSISVVAQVAEFFRPVTTLIGQGLSSISALYSSVTGFISAGITAVTNFVGLTTAATAGVVDAISTGAAGTGTASEAASVAGSGANATSAALSKVAVALAVIKFGYDMFTNWSNDTLTLHTKVTNSLYAMSDALLAASIATLNWPLAIAAAALNVVGVVSDVLENGFNKSNMLRLLLGPLSGLFDKQRTPNAWMNTYNPDQAGGNYNYNPNGGTYTATGNKSAYVGEQTPFGMTVISTHEMSLSAAEMVNAFGGLLTTVKAVDTDLYHTINRLDAKFEETGKTMAYYNNLLKDGNPGATSVSTKQNASDLNTGGMLTARYNWITDQLAASGSQVGQYINAWFDVITNKFISVSKDNSMFVLGVIDSLATNLESFMQFPLALVGLIGSSVKSVSSGGTPDAVMAEVMGVLNTFTLVKTGFQQLNLAADDNRIVSFLAGINAIGYGVQDAGLNLLAYGIALQKIGGAIAASGDALMSTVEAKFVSLKNQGMDTTQINAFFGSFGIMANMFAEAGVAFGEADLDSAAKYLHDMAKASVDVAKNTIDHAIANEKLTGITRAAAIATLVKTGKLEEAVVAEAEYGISIQNATKDMLAQMGFIQQLGFAANKSLSDMGIGASAWTAAANNVVSVFGDMEKAMSWLDATAKTFLSVKDYAQYNLDTIDRGISNIKESNPSLAGITDASIREAFKSGASALDLITELAKNLGGETPTIKALVDLYGQRVAAEEALNTAMGRTTETVEQATARYQELQSAISASNTDFARRNNSAIENELFALHDMAVKMLLDWKALGASAAEMQIVYDQAITRGAEATAKAIESIQNAFDSIYQSIAKKRTSMADDLVRVTAPSTLSGIQQQRAQANLASDDYATQMAAVDTLHTLIMDSYNRQIDAAKTLVDASKAINDYLNKLLLNTALTTLSPEAMLSESRAQYGVQLALAKAGDKDAMIGITRIADSYLNSAKDYFASTEDYVAIFNQIRGDLAGLTTSTTLEQRTTTAVETMTIQLATLTEELNAIEAQQRVKEAGQIDAINSSAAAILASLNAAILAIDGISINLVGGLEAFRLALLLDLESMILSIDVIPNIPDSVKDLAAEVARNMELIITATASSSLSLPIKQLTLDNVDGIIKMVNLTVAASSNDPATIALGQMAADMLAKQVEFYVSVGDMSDEVRVMGLGVTDVLRKYATVILTSELDIAGKNMGLNMLDVARKYTDLIINSTLDTTAKNLKLNEADIFVKAALLQLTATGAFTPDQRALIDAADGMTKTVAMTGRVSISGLTPQIVAVLDALPSATKTLTLNEILTITGVDATTAGIIQAAPDSVKTLTLNQVLAKYSGFIDTAALAVLNSAPSSIKSLTLNEILAIYGLDANTNAVLNAAPNASKSLTLEQYVSLGSIATRAQAILDMPGSSSKSLTAGVNATLSGNLDAAKIAANGVTGTTSYVAASATLMLDSVLNNSILSYSRSEVANVYNAIANNTAATVSWLANVYYRLGQPMPVQSVYRWGTLATFAKGGIAREASIFGEAGPEAAVPLPDGRSIPVKFSGNPGGDNKETVAELKQQTQELKAARREANQKADAMIQRLAMMERRLAQIEATGALAGAA